VANVDARQPLRKGGSVEGCQRPLREVVGESFQKMVSAQTLEGVIENGGIARLFQAFQKFRDRVGPLILDLGQVGRRRELKRLFCCIHAVSFCKRSRHPRTWTTLASR